jgi:uncharacterized membrane protein
MKNKKFFFLLFTALVFFLAYFIMISRMPDPFMDNLVPFIVAGLSFCGAVLFVTGMKHVSNRWYLGIPHVIMIGMVCISIVGKFFSVAHNTEYLNMSLALLSITSTGFFMAFPGPERKILRLFTLVSGVIGLYAIFLIYQSVSGLMHPLQTSWNVIGAYAGIYLLFLLPVIGICHIGAALGERSLP